VRETETAKLVHAVAAAYGTRPSEILGIESRLAAWNLDAAVLVIGRMAEAEDRDSKYGPSANRYRARPPRKVSGQKRTSPWLQLARDGRQTIIQEPHER